MTTVGRFSYNAESGTVSGPADYMNSPQYSERMEKIYAGTCAVFNMNPSPDVYLRVLVSLQTDYAAFQGMKEMMSWG